MKLALTAKPIFPKLAPVPAALEQQYGEVSEWLKEHAWKVCIRQRIEGSNPSLTAIFKEELACKCGLFFRMLHTQGVDENPRQGSTKRQDSRFALPPATHRASAMDGASDIPPSPPYLKKSSHANAGFFFACCTLREWMRTLDRVRQPASAGWTAASLVITLPRINPSFIAIP